MLARWHYHLAQPRLCLCSLSPLKIFKSLYIHIFLQLPCCPCFPRGAQLCCWSTWLGAWQAPSQSPLTWTSHPSTTSSWRAAMAATSSTSPREREPRSTSLTPTAPRRNPQSTFRALLNRSAWHGSTSWCVLFCWHLLLEKNHFKLLSFVFVVKGWHWQCIPYIYRFYMRCGSYNKYHCFTNIIMVCVNHNVGFEMGFKK